MANKDHVIPMASAALDQFKLEIANEIAEQDPEARQAIQEYLNTGYGGNLPARYAGAIGGHMVSRMIAAAEQSLVQQFINKQNNS